ncbi:hypothetical protein SMICM304S_11392 [Streptomyces microflavus]
MTTTAPESASYFRPVILSVSSRTFFIAWASSYSATAWTRASRLVTRVEPDTAGSFSASPMTRPRLSTS